MVRGRAYLGPWKSLRLVLRGLVPAIHIVGQTQFLVGGALTAQNWGRVLFSAGSFLFLLASSDLRNKTKCLALNPTLQKIGNQAQYTQTSKAGASDIPS